MKPIYRLLFFDYRTEQMIALLNTDKSKHRNNLHKVAEAEKLGKCLIIDAGIKKLEELDEEEQEQILIK